MLFWNVDTQCDFMRADGKLPVPGAESIEGKLEELTSYARGNNITIVNTADWHHADSQEFSSNPDYHTTFPEHCMANTPGADYVPATQPNNPYIIDWQDTMDSQLAVHAKEITLYKDAFDVFAGTPHADTLVDLLAPKRAVVYGVATNVCVDFAVKGLLERGVEVHVPIDAIKELPGLPVEEVFDQWKERGAILTTVNQIIQKQ